MSSCFCGVGGVFIGISGAGVLVELAAWVPEFVLGWAFVGWDGWEFYAFVDV